MQHEVAGYMIYLTSYISELSVYQDAACTCHSAFIACFLAVLQHVFDMALCAIALSFPKVAVIIRL